MLPQPPTPTIEDEFLPKALVWNDCFCCVCNFFLNNPAWDEYRKHFGMCTLALTAQKGRPTKTKPTKICRTLWLNWHQDIQDKGIEPYNWENETSEYNPDSFKEPPIEEEKD